MGIGQPQYGGYYPQAQGMQVPGGFGYNEAEGQPLMMAQSYQMVPQTQMAPQMVSYQMQPQTMTQSYQTPMTQSYQMQPQGFQPTPNTAYY